MGDGIEEAVLLLISPDLADEEDSVYDQPCDQHTEENDAEHERNNLPPMENDPTDIEYDRQGNEASPERDEERDSFGAARDAHDVLVYARASDCHISRTVKSTCGSPDRVRKSRPDRGKRINRRWISPGEKLPGQPLV